MLLLAHQLGHKATDSGFVAAPDAIPYSKRRRFAHMHPPLAAMVMLWMR